MTNLEVVAAVFLKGGRVLGCRRAPGRSAAGKWELPGGKVEPGEDPRDALRREVSEELGVEVMVGDLLDRSSTVVGTMTIDLACYSVMLTSNEPSSSTDHDALMWLEPANVMELEWATPDLPMIRKVSKW
ncbi:(deoxy)nucleoside triphosphate pyrophosphohydrolase [Herbiconiux sp. KACC 21604]|uniref:(deoxy)nucleoside triphosphate pyrophosphohydrolase n=1 Tax=unclassified Herbiconiux TaxID=2618217 RepID=UPI0014920880|nr:(deoxy)nucleoside triphosphate pyrophosphohydrolase [Herbiconiux sp. SALV-R1]QJU52784.1 (deoxy)nucleoside triphosphate pyrophosphohydrolase [Herbiconiux sp. SALV-R1]WPO87690.1 (deoxy)nucleoside triphosphate pyrophosphohydrolase [Herbiconiux sp. KACC 21604]